MGLYANYPIALAPGMGLNAFFAFTIVVTYKYSWQQGLAAVFCSGALFLLISVFPIRRYVIDSIPPVRRAEGGCAGDDEQCERNRVAAYEVRSVAQKGRVRVVHGDGNEACRTASHEVPAYEISQRHELPNVPRRCDQCLEPLEGHVHVAV